MVRNRRECHVRRGRVTADWFGYWSAIYPNHAGSAGEAWGIALIIWAFTFIGVVGWRLPTVAPRQAPPDKARRSGS